MADLAKVECLELGLGLLWVVLVDVARAEAVAALCEAMVFVVAQGARCGGIFHKVRDFPTWWGLRVFTTAVVSLYQNYNGTVHFQQRIYNDATNYTSIITHQ